MALILAIETDRRQLSKLAMLARNYLHEEIVVTESIGRAMAKVAADRFDFQTSFARELGNRNSRRSSPGHSQGKLLFHRRALQLRQPCLATGLVEPR